MSAQHDQLRRVLESIPDKRVPSRKCPNCRTPLWLTRGRHSQKLWWTHEYLNECPLGKVGRAIHFTTEKQAVEAEVIFR